MRGHKFTWWIVCSNSLKEDFPPWTQVRYGIVPAATCYDVDHMAWWFNSNLSKNLTLQPFLHRKIVGTTPTWVAAAPDTSAWENLLLGCLHTPCPLVSHGSLVQAFPSDLTMQIWKLPSHTLNLAYTKLVNLNTPAGTQRKTKNTPWIWMKYKKTISALGWTLKEFNFPRWCTSWNNNKWHLKYPVVEVQVDDKTP